MKLVRDLDIFGTGIQWRLLSKDKFKSCFGGFTTLILLTLFIIKLILFLNKIKTYGFARNQVSYQFQDDYQITNLSDFNIALFTDLEQKMKDAYKYNLTKKNYLEKNEAENKPFNLTDYLIIGSNSDHMSDKPINLEILQIDCGFPDSANMICLRFTPGKDFINITKNETFIPDSKQNPTIYQFDRIPQFYLTFQPKKDLAELLKETKAGFTIGMIYTYFNINPKDYSYKTQLSVVEFDFEYLFESKSILNFRKSSIRKKFEFDTFEFELDKKEAFSIDNNSFKSSRKMRLPQLLETEGYNLIDQFHFGINILEEINEVTYLTLDDILAVLGGFMQITISFAEIVAGFYNEGVGQRMLRSYCIENVTGYERKINEIKDNVKIQMEFMRKLKISEQKQFNSERSDANKTSELKHFICNNDNSNSYEDKTNVDEQTPKNFYSENCDKFNKEERSFSEKSKFSEVNHSKKGLHLSIDNKTHKEHYSPTRNMNINSSNIYLKEAFVKQKKCKDKVVIEMQEIQSDKNTKKSEDYQHKKKNKSLIASSKHRKNPYIKANFDFYEFISIDKYMKLLSGFEAFKFFYFNKINKFNFENYSNLHIYSQHYNFLAVNDTHLDLNEENLNFDANQDFTFREINRILDEY